MSTIDLHGTQQVHLWKSGDWLRHSRTLKWFLQSHSPLSCGFWDNWHAEKTQRHLIFNTLADGQRFSLKLSQHMTPFNLSVTQIGPGPFSEKQPQNTEIPSPCFTVCVVFLCSLSPLNTTSWVFYQNVLYCIGFSDFLWCYFGPSCLQVIYFRLLCSSGDHFDPTKWDFV